jgi:hypothetical protein
LQIKLNKTRLGTHQSHRNLTRTMNISERLLSPKSVGDKNKGAVKPVTNKAEALEAINEIYKKRKATLDRRVFILKSKTRELTRLEAEVLHMNEPDSPVEEQYEPSVSI